MGSCRRNLLDQIIALNERHLSDCSPSMFVTIMRTVRIPDLRRGHLTAEFDPKLRVRPLPRSDSEGCTIVTIVRHSPDQLSNGPLYMCAPRAGGLALPQSLLAVSSR